MFFHAHHTIEEVVLQESHIIDSWNQEVVPSLPKDLDEQAWRLGAMSRRGGKVEHASDLLRAILAYVLTAKSFRAVGIWGVVTAGVDMANTSWRERFRKSGAWIFWVLNELLRIERNKPAPILKKKDTSE